MTDVRAASRHDPLTPQYSVEELKAHLPGLATRMRFPGGLETAFRRDNYASGRPARWFVLSLPIFVFVGELVLSLGLPGQLPPPRWLLSVLAAPIALQLAAALATLARHRHAASDALTLLTGLGTAYGLLELNLGPTVTLPMAPNYLAAAYIAALFFLVRAPFQLLLLPMTGLAAGVLLVQWRYLPMGPRDTIDLGAQLLMFAVGAVGGHALELAHRRDWLRLQMLEATARTDALTGIFNRRGFDEAFSTQLRLAAREQRRTGLILVDLDYFKSLNDIYGHEEGDLCLRSIAQTLNRFARRPLDQAARLGGEEFALTLYNCPAEVLVRRADDLRAAVEALRIPNAGSQVSPHVTVSIGAVSIDPAFPADTREALRQADQLLYSAKNNGRNRIATAEYQPGGG